MHFIRPTYIMKKISLYTFCFIVAANMWRQFSAAEPVMPYTAGTLTMLFRISRADIDSSFTDNAKKD